MNLAIFPPLNASLNAASGILLVLGYFFIRRKDIARHKACMLSACATSVLFLICYLTYHYFHGSTRFQGQGMIRTVYFTILISHTILAALVPVLAGIVLFHAFRGNFPKHAAIARITLPIWLYVSVTGVIVYWMLYQIRY